MRFASSTQPQRKFMPLLARMWKMTALMELSSLSLPITGFVQPWIWSNGRARLFSKDLTVNSPTSQLWSMDKLTIIIATKRMPFASLVGDHPVYVLITLLKSGWLSILQNEKQLLVHSRDVNNDARTRASHNVLANQKDAKRKHMECGPKWM